MYNCAHEKTILIKGEFNSVTRVLKNTVQCHACKKIIVKRRRIPSKYKQRDFNGDVVYT